MKVVIFKDITDTKYCTFKLNKKYKVKYENNLMYFIEYENRIIPGNRDRFYTEQEYREIKLNEILNDSNI
jgi:hypothetical protein